MMRGASFVVACLLALAQPALAADPEPEPEAEPDLSTLRLTAPPQIPPFDPALLERIRSALARADAAAANGAAAPATSDD